MSARNDLLARISRGKTAVDRDAAVAIAKPRDEVAVQERPRRLAVQEQHRRAGSLVDVMHARSRDVGVATLERVELAWNELEGAETAWLAGTSRKRLMGLEPTTFCMASRRSSQLSYSRARRGSIAATIRW
jgi:hypothetical protein